MPLYMTSSGSSAAAAGGIVSSIARMPISHAAASSFYSTVTATNPSSAATFWSHWGQHATTVDTDFSANTYKTILNVSGAGELCNILGPTSMLGTEVQDFRVTIDGVATTVTASVGSGKRIYFGAFSRQGTNATSGVGFGNADVLSGGAISSNKKYNESGSSHVIGVSEYRGFNLPRVRFGTSCLVEIRVANANADTAVFGRTSGAGHLLDA